MTELARIEKVIFFQSVDFFHFCRAEEILRIAAIGRERDFAPGEVLYEEGDPARELYCVVRGRIDVRHSDGAEVQVGPLGTVGVRDILSGRLRTSRAVAPEEGLALAIEAEDLFDLLSNNIDIVKALFRRVLQPGGETLRGALP